MRYDLSLIEWIFVILVYGIVGILIWLILTLGEKLQKAIDRFMFVVGMK